ncbi:MAG TPA: hypothetical protein VE570_12010 [Thermoleophilaceae bacterium]|nr:hypothetical protein [Thermoleophilaceae bacterium]
MPFLLWAATNLALAIVAALYAWLGFALERSECMGSDCEDWPAGPTADAAAAGLTVTALVAWAATGGRWHAFLAIGSAALLVPLYHLVGLDYF